MHPRICAALVLAAAAGAPHAQTLFAEDFDAAPLGTDVTPPGWTVSSGTVDVIGAGFFDLLAGNGRYVDLDGSTNDAGVLARTFALTAGVAYTAFFDLAGSQRGGSETVDVGFGTATASYTLPSSAGFGTGSLVFTPGTTGTYTLSFANQGGDNQGALLDNVRITSAVPEPAAAWTLLLGAGFLAWRRRNQAF